MKIDLQFKPSQNKLYLVSIFDIENREIFDTISVYSSMYSSIVHSNIRVPRNLRKPVYAVMI